MGRFLISLQEGFRIEDIENSRPVTILGAEIAEILFEGAVPIGQSIRVDGRPYTVIGVAAPRGNVFGQTLDRLVLMPYISLMYVYGRERDITVFPAGSAIAGVIVMTIIGIVFGVYPAFKAAQLDPIESLRYE